jgi:methionine-gamma-lyase
MKGPWTQWLMMRSLETLKIRMERQAETARKIADFLVRHPKVEKVYYLGHLEKGTPEHAIYQRQCLGAGAMLSFDVVRGEKAAFRFLNALRLISLAVSLGGTESLAEHPASMTHCDIPEEERDRIGITDKLVRISVGLEDPDDLIRDIEQALAEV